MCKVVLFMGRIKNTTLDLCFLCNQQKPPRSIAQRFAQIEEQLLVGIEG